MTLNVGVIRSGSDLGLGMAVERGYFQQEGLELNLVDFTTSADMMAPLAGDQLDVAAGGVNAGVFNSVAQGVRLKIAANLAVNTPVDKSIGWLVRTDLVASGRVQEPRDLKGLTIGLGEELEIRPLVAPATLASARCTRRLGVTPRLGAS